MRMRWRYLAVLAVAVPVLVFGIAWSGLIGVRASTGHWAATDWFLHWVMRNSVRTASLSTEPSRHDDLSSTAAAAAHFQSGCAVCHGSPAGQRSSAMLSMLPPPPDLSVAVNAWTDAQLFEIVKHGVRFTGMPSWPTQVRDDEVWAMVGFLRNLPQMSARDYIELSGLQLTPTARSLTPLVMTCESCHAQGGLGNGGAVPLISGQSEAYLLESLKAYKAGRRPSGIMSVALGPLSQDDLKKLAGHYAEQRVSWQQVGPTDAERYQAGLQLAQNGRSIDRIPACLSCHERDNGNEDYPRLFGQNAAYLGQQLRLFQMGVRGGGKASHLMAVAAKNLTDEDIDTLASFFSQRNNDRPSAAMD